MNWISRYLALLEVREANRVRQTEAAVAFARERWMAKQAAHVALARATVAPAQIVIPEDLEAVILQESAEWLRDEMRQEYRKRYLEHGDWNRVRAAIGIGTIDGG